MARQHQIRGFSLLEMMIVLLIIGIGAATIRVAVTKKDPLEPLEKNAYEFSGWLNRLTDDVLLRNRELGLFFTETEVGVMTWRESDSEKNEPEGPVWELLESDPNFETTFEFNDDRDTVIELIKNIESAEWVTLEKSLPDQEDLEDLGDFLTPHLILLPSEEYLPSFQLIYRQRDETELQISVLGDGYNRVEVSREAQ